MKDATFPPDCLFITYNRYMEPEMKIHAGYDSALSHIRLYPHRAITYITQEEYEIDGITLRVTS